MGRKKGDLAERFSGWYPSDVRFRKEFNAAIIGAVRHIAVHGDSRVLGSLLEAVPDEEIRRRMARRLVQLLPIHYDRKKSSFTLREGRRDFDWLAVDHINVFDPQIVASGNQVKVGSTELSVDEFVDECLDAMILARRLLKPEHLARLSEVLGMITARKRGLRSNEPKI